MIPGKVWRLVCTPFPKHDSSKTKNPHATISRSEHPGTYSTNQNSNVVNAFFYALALFGTHAKAERPSSSSICTCANKETKNRSTPDIYNQSTCLSGRPDGRLWGGVFYVSDLDLDQQHSSALTTVLPSFTYISVSRFVFVLMNRVNRMSFPDCLLPGSGRVRTQEEEDGLTTWDGRSVARSFFDPHHPME
jgi:hypothetical protein